MVSLARAARRVRIWATEEGKIHGSVMSPAGLYDCFARAICCLSGPVAEEKLTGSALRSRRRANRDVEMAQEALARLGDDQPELDAVIGLATAIVDCNWPAITRVADELMRRRQLDWDEFAALLGSW